jgi:glycosyltransferase involved in cell wall biosynthesis
MPTVLHVTQPTVAGVATYVAALCADQQARGWDVAVACPDRGRLADDLATGGIRRVTWQADRSPGVSVAGEALRLSQLFDRIGPDLVHLHSSKAGLAGRLAARGRLPTMFQPHGWSWLAAPRPVVRAAVAWERLAARWTALYVCVGEGEAAQARAQGLSGRYCVVRSGVNLKRFPQADEADRRKARALLSLPTEAPLAVCVGRVTRQKGQDLLLAAWPLVRARCPDARLAVVGGGDLLEPLRWQAPPGVLFTGPVDDARPWYAAADLAVLPSRWEGLPLTLLEALAVGRPVVGNDIPGIADVLPRGAGAVVPAGDLVALAEAISYRIHHPDVARAEGKAGARYAAAEADAQRSYETLASVVTACLANSRH